MRRLLLDIVINSDTIKKSISNFDRKQLIEAIKILPNNQLIRLCSILEKKKFDFDKLGRKIERGLLVAAVMPVPATTELYVVYKLITKLNYQCLYKCNVIKNDLDKRLCYKKCEVISLEKAITAVKKELGDCWYEKNPEKCRQTIVSYLQDLHERLGKAKIKLSDYQHKVEMSKRDKKLKIEKMKQRELAKKNAKL